MKGHPELASNWIRVAATARPISEDVYRFASEPTIDGWTNEEKDLILNSPVVLLSLDSDWIKSDIVRGKLIAKASSEPSQSSKDIKSTWLPKGINDIPDTFIKVCLLYFLLLNIDYFSSTGGKK